MSKILVSAIAALDKNRGIAKNGQIPWQIRDDMKHFRDITTGHVVIMGRKTFETMNKPLSNRTNIIVTRDKEYKRDDCIVTHSIDEALEIAKQKEPTEIFICGGEQIYTAALPQTERLYLTIINESFDCDTFFPDYKEFTTILSKEEKSENNLTFTYITLTR